MQIKYPTWWRMEIMYTLASRKFMQLFLCTKLLPHCTVLLWAEDWCLRVWDEHYHKMHSFSYLFIDILRKFCSNDPPTRTLTLIHYIYTCCFYHIPVDGHESVEMYKLTGLETLDLIHWINRKHNPRSKYLSTSAPALIFKGVYYDVYILNVL